MTATDETGLTSVVWRSLLSAPDLYRTMSVEVTPSDLAACSEPVACLQPLPAGTRIFISHLEQDCVDDSLRVAAVLAKTHCRAVPHVVARHYQSEQALHQSLNMFQQLAEVQEIMLLAGDRRHAAGPYQNSLDVLQSGVLAGRGLKKLWFGAHPEGHPHACQQTLDQLIHQKIQGAQQLGCECAFISQLCFAAPAWLDWIGRHGGQTADFIVHPSVFIKASQRSLRGLATLIKTPSARLFLRGTITPPSVSGWQYLFTATAQLHHAIGGLHFLSLGCLEDNVRLLVAAANKQSMSGLV